MRRLSFAVAERCAYPFRYGLPTTCSDVIIYKNSECADRRASAPAPSGCAARRHEESFLVLNIKTVYLVHTTTLTQLTLRSAGAPELLPEPAVLKSRVRTPRKTHEPRRARDDPYTPNRLDISARASALRHSRSARGGSNNLRARERSIFADSCSPGWRLGGGIEAPGNGECEQGHG